jgi:hypothetical protein
MNIPGNEEIPSMKDVTEPKQPETNPAQKNVENVTKTFNGKILHTKKELDDLFKDFAKYMQENEKIISDDELKTAATFFNLYKQGIADYEKTNNFFTLLKKSVDGMDKAIDSAIDEADKVLDYLDLGFVNSWNGEEPEEFTKCKNLNHDLKIENIGRCQTKKTCDICRISYKVDSSD